MSIPAEPWLALMVGNSRLHWACFWGDRLHRTWDTPHLKTAPELKGNNPWNSSAIFDFPPDLPSFSNPPALWLASVVPEQTTYFQNYPRLHPLTLEQVPLKNIYPTLGIDRALALWGTLQQYGSPALTIDAGTALTLTGADPNASLVGGAILPGLGLQLRSLSTHTALLPLLYSDAAAPLPPHWATSTVDAIQSGVLYGLTAAIQHFAEDWLQQFPDSAIALTGGDAVLLYRAIAHLNPLLALRIQPDPHLVFWGIRAIALQLQENHKQTTTQKQTDFTLAGDTEE